MNPLALLNFLNPMRIRGLGMNPNLALVSKLLFLILALKGYYKFFSEPFVPFLPIFEVFEGVEWYATMLQIGFLWGGGLLLLNLMPRLGSFLAGSTVLIGMLDSRLDFYNHTFLTCSILILCAFESEENPRFVRYQLVIVYIGAAVNKIFMVDWWNGQFFANWIGTRLDAPYFEYAATFFSDGVFYALLGWSSIVIELIIGFSLAVTRFQRFGIWAAAVFHFSTFVVTSGELFGFFIPTLFVALTVFRPISPNALHIEIGSESNKGTGLRYFWKLLKAQDFAILRISDSTTSGLKLKFEGVSYQGMEALRTALYQSSVFHFFVFSAFWGINRYLESSTAILAFLFVLFFLILFPIEVFNKSITRFRQLIFIDPERNEGYSIKVLKP